MNVFISVIELIQNWNNTFPFVLSLFLKTSFLVMVVLLITKYFYKATATIQHFFWFITFICLLVMPAVYFIPSFWQLSLPTSDLISHLDKSSGFEVNQSILSAPVNGTGHKQDQLSLKKSPEIVELSNSEQYPENGNVHIIHSLKRYLLPGMAVIWLFGLLFLFIKQLIGMIFLHSLIRKSCNIKSPLFVQLLAKTGLKRHILSKVRLFKCEKITVPVSCGIFFPKIIVPASFQNWPEKHQRFTLLHELAHIRRRDILKQSVIQAVSGIYWPNPLVWIARRQLIKAREQACDDYVVTAGCKPGDYANFLLRIAQSNRRYLFSFASALFMAEKTQLEGRLLSILSKKLKQPYLTRSLVAKVLIIFSALLIPLIAVTFSSQNTSSSKENFNIPQEYLKDSSLATRLETVWMSFEMKEEGLDNLYEALLDESWEIRKIAAWALGEIKQPEAIPELAKLLDDPNVMVRRQVVEALDNMKHKDAIKSLCAAIIDKDTYVRRGAASALDEFKDSNALEALLNALEDSNNDIKIKREVVESLGDMKYRDAVVPLMNYLTQTEERDTKRKIIWALGEIGDSRATDVLIEVLHAEHSDLRRESIKALAKIKDPRAVMPICSSLQDRDWKVRLEGVCALDEFRNPSVITYLEPLIEDRKSNIREETVETMGEICDKRAIPSLSIALKDRESEVRQKAAWALGEIGDKSALVPLQNAISDRNIWVSREVAKSIRIIKKNL